MIALVFKVAIGDGLYISFQGFEIRCRMERSYQMTKNNIVPNLQTKVTFGRFKQIYFTLKEVIKIAFRIQPKLLVAVLILNAVWGFSAVPGFYLEKLIIDKFVQGITGVDWKPVFYQVALLLAFSLGLSLFRNILGSYNRFLRRTLSRYVDSELDVLIGNKVSVLKLSVIESPQFKDRFSKVQRESGRRAWGLMMPISDIPNYVIGFASAVAILILVNPFISIGVLIFSIPRFLIDSKFIKKDYELDTQMSTKYRIWGWLRYYLVENRNFIELKLLKLTNYLSGRMRNISTEVIKKRIELNKKREISSFLGHLPLTIYDYAISLFLAFLVIIGKITVGSFQLYLRSLRSAEENLGGLVSSFLEIYENYIYVVDLVWFLNIKEEVQKEDEVKTIDDSSIEIEFKNVWFKYPRTDKWVLTGVNLKVKPSEKLALVGENGAGKSTLIKLLGGFYLPKKGKILINGKDLNEIDLSAWRDKLAVLFQQFETYPFSAKESIGYGDIQRIEDFEGIKEAAKKTGVDEYIEELPLKYNNPLAPEFDRGVNPSIGQWQRIGIARMLFRKAARILILDEPTSNVDPEAEEKIFKELVKVTRGKILIFVTQRFSTVRIADRIFVMHQGQIIEEGTHRSLMEKDGKYKRLFTLQAQAYLS